MLPAIIGFRQLVDFAKLRQRIEGDYQELEQEVGLGPFEGHRWRGLHHHATMWIAAYGFLISERETISPLKTSSHHAVRDACHVWTGAPGDRQKVEVRHGEGVANRTGPE